MDRLVVALLNTGLEHTDPFEAPPGTARWWAQHSGRGSAPFAEVKPRFDASLSAALRSMRAAVAAMLEGDGEALPLTFRGDSSDAILFRLTHAVASAVASGEIHRVRRCRRQTCGCYFLDETKNGSRRWCSLRCMERARAPRRRTISR